MDYKNIFINDRYVEKLIEAKDIIENDYVLFTEDVYDVNFFSAKVIGKRHIYGKINKTFLNDNSVSYSIDVLECIGTNKDEILKKQTIRRKETTIFKKYKVYRKLWNNEINRFLFLDFQEQEKKFAV